MSISHYPLLNSKMEKLLKMLKWNILPLELRNTTRLEQLAMQSYIATGL